MTSDCREICKCRNLCHPGWIGEFRSADNLRNLKLKRNSLSLQGKNCSQPCPENTFGRLCAQNCTCLPDNTQTCNHESGFCTCEDRFHGLNCEFFCEPTKNILICPSHSRHDCRCEPTLEHKYETLASTVDHLAKSVDQSTDADEKIVRMKKILLSLEKIDEGMKRLRNEKDWYSFATHSVVLLLLFSLLSVLIYRTVTSFRLNGSASRSVRYSRRSGEAFNNSIYSETLLAGSSDRTLPRPATAGQPKGDFKISNPFRSSKFLNRLSNFNLTENLFGQRKSPDNALNDVDRRSINEPELKGSEICSTINIMNNLNDQKTESEETVRMTGWASAPWLQLSRDIVQSGVFLKFQVKFLISSN